MDHGRSWKIIAKLLPNKTVEAVRKRGNKIIAMEGLDIIKRKYVTPGKWTVREDELLREGILRTGKDWLSVTKKLLPDRTEMAIKVRGNNLISSNTLDLQSPKRRRVDSKDSSSSTVSSSRSAQHVVLVSSTSSSSASSDVGEEDFGSPTFSSVGSPTFNTVSNSAEPISSTERDVVLSLGLLSQASAKLGDYGALVPRVESASTQRQSSDS